MNRFSSKPTSVACLFFTFQDTRLARPIMDRWTREERLQTREQESNEIDFYMN